MRAAYVAGGASSIDYNGCDLLWASRDRRVACAQIVGRGLALAGIVGFPVLVVRAIYRRASSDWH